MRPMENVAGDWVSSVTMFVFAAGAVAVGWRPLCALIAAQEEQFSRALRGTMMMDVSRRLSTYVTAAMVVVGALVGYGVTENLFGAFVLAVGAAFVPWLVLKAMLRRRLLKLEDQLVNAIQMLASGVRAGLNLVQSMNMVAHDGPRPIKDEFAHMMREYEYGVSLEDVMDNCANRVGSGDFRLLFAALQTHRERGGDLGETLDRIAESIREIQRLENRVKTLTAQGRANARMMGMLVIVSLLILYGIDPQGVKILFEQNVGKGILAVIILLNVAGFLWIKKIVSIDI